MRYRHTYAILAGEADREENLGDLGIDRMIILKCRGAGLICLRVISSGRVVWTRFWTFRFRRVQESLCQLSDCQLLKNCALWWFGFYQEGVKNGILMCSRDCEHMLVVRRSVSWYNIFWKYFHMWFGKYLCIKINLTSVHRKCILLNHINCHAIETPKSVDPSDKN
jgi:hypothetical protein